MSRDRDIERTIRDGKRNHDAKRLIHNWCRHARVEKFGGTGIIEMQTGLPIGHHAMVCDFASASGMATWLLEESAMRFHDANCVSCPHRVPVALPNLAMLVAQRDADRQDAQTRAQEAQYIKEAALQTRAAVRAELRATLPVLAKAFMDDMDRLDAERNEQAATRLIESARLAPEILVPALTEYLFSVLEGDDHWLETAALTILADTPDQRRLVRCGMKCLRQGYALELAAATVTQRLDHVDAADIPEAVMGLAYVASPPRSEFGRPHYDDGDPDPLTQVADRFPKAVERGLLALLAHRDRLRVGVTIRAMGMLIARNTRWIRPFLRPLAAHLSRLDVLVEFERESELRQIVHDLQVTLAHAFLAAPDLADDELMRQFESASDDGEGRVAGVYEHVLRHAHRDRDAKPVIDPAHTQAFGVAIRRLAALSASSDNNAVSQQVLSAFRRQSAALAPAAKAAMDVLLGTAAILDSRLQAPEPEPSILTPPNPLGQMEKANRRSNLWHLRAALLELAIHGALADAEGLAHFEGFLSQRGLLGDTFEAAIVREIAPLLATSAGLKAMLPYLYGAMVGASVVGRAAAADALKDIGSQRFADLPNLVSDSLVLMLFDPYVMVHKAAVLALGRLRLPAHFHRMVAAALDNLIVAYRGGNDPEFLLECIEAKVTTYRGKGPLSEAQGQLLLALIAELEPSALLRSGHRYFLRGFHHLDGWAALVLGWVGQCQQDYELEHALELMADLPLGACAPQVPAILEAVATDPSNPQLCSTFVELLTRDRAWQGATQVVALHVAAFPDTVRERARRLQAQQLERRVRFEYLINEGLLREALALGKAWMQANDELAQLFKNDENSLSFESLQPRLQAVEALAAIAIGQWPPHDLKVLAAALDAVSATMSSAVAATAYNAFGGILRIVDMLAHWRRAVLEAEPDADRYVRSARERYRLWLNDYDQSDAAAQLCAAVAGLATLESTEQVAGIARALTLVPLPIGIFAQPAKPDWVVQADLTRPKEEPLVDLTVAFLKFQFDGQPAAEVHQLEAREVHDLEIEVRVSRWPEDKRELRLTPISVEPKSTYDFPSFQFQKPDGDAPYTMQQSGRAALLLPQGMHARPFEFKYTAEFIPERGDQPVAVVGHRTLIVDGADASKLQVCGYPGLDQALYALRDTLRRRPGVPQSETADALLTLAALCNLAGRAVQDAKFKGRWDEAAFQRYVRAELRRHPLIGADLDEHAHAAGGITDLSLRGIPIELKAVDTLISSVDQCDPFLAQTASYAVAKSKRTAILCVLDSSEKKTAPVPPETLLDIRTHAQGAVSICVLVIQGHLARPSALSR